MRNLKLLAVLAGGIVALSGAVLLGVWLLVNPNAYKGKIAAAVKESTGRELKLPGDIKLSVLPWVALELGPASLGNPPGFSDEPFLSFTHASVRVSERSVPDGTFGFGVAFTARTLRAVAEAERATFDRLVDAFPAEEQAQVRTTLAESLAAVVSQLLLRTADGRGRCAVTEILLKTAGLPNVIREGNTPMLTTIMQGGRAVGMQLMDDGLAALVEAKRVTAREAYLKASNKARFEGLIED